MGRMPDRRLEMFENEIAKLVKQLEDIRVWVNVARANGDVKTARHLLGRAYTIRQDKDWLIEEMHRQKELYRLFNVQPAERDR